MPIDSLPDVPSVKGIQNIAGAGNLENLTTKTAVAFLRKTS
jgi:hypothetical protein